MTLETALEVLRKHKEEFREKYGITALGIFGSVALGRMSDESDVDVVIKMSKPDLFFMVHIKEELESDYKTRVDVVRYREKMNKFLKERIDRDAVYV
ncbi:MAG: nucleotidyltransferase domain-containing protein [Nitrospirae bacterium]|nr:nucleotidyltransferase domain-containing protein [Nitrospirota bacterium]